jgi:hypothetical protein
MRKIILDLAHVKPYFGSAMKKQISALLFLGLLAASSAQSADRLDLGLYAAATADLATTTIAFKVLPGARDANPAVHGPTSAIAVKAASTAAILLMDRHLKRTGHPRAAKVLKITAIVAWGTCAAWNARQIAKH